MTIASEFNYVRPSSIGEMDEILSEYGDRACVLAGGTDLVGMLMDSMVQPEILVDIKELDSLRGVTFENEVLRIGALATFNEVMDAGPVRESYPLIREMVGMVASGGLRNRATLVGNLCSAVPCCDAGPIMLVYEAEVEVHGKKGERSVPIRDWFVGPRQTACADDEVATRVSVPLPKAAHAGCYVKLKRYWGEDLAQASVAVLVLEGHTYRIAFGSVAPTPIRGEAIEALLNGNALSPELIEKAKSLVSETIAPITDIRGSKEYRMLMTEVMLERGLQAAVARLGGEGPAYGVNLI